MSRRSQITVEILLRIPLPPGVKTQASIDFIRAAIKAEHERQSPTSPLHGLGLNGITATLHKRTTTYY